MRTQVWSNGGGTQSTAIAALIIQGKLPKPDYAVIADTNRELSSTWDYLNTVTGPALKAVGVEVVRVDKSQWATVDLFGGKGKDSLLIPAFTDKGGEIGKMPGFCSNEWKKRSIERYLASLGVKQYDIWIGFSTDELRRVPKVRDENRTPHYPLVGLKMNRGDCIALVASMGWPPPPRPSCYMCPNHTQVEWRSIRDDYPADWRRAVAFEKHIQKTDPNAWLHGDAVPLDKAQLDDMNETMFGHFPSGMCFT